MRKREKSPMIGVGCAVLTTALFTSAFLIPKHEQESTSKVEPYTADMISTEKECEFCSETQIEMVRVSSSVPLDYHLQERLQEFCGDYGVPYEIALAVIYQESRFESTAQNGNCIGYMQVNTVNLEWLNEEIGTTDLYDPLQNLKAGTFILGRLFEKYGEANMALTAYNHGESGAKKKFFDRGRIASSYSIKVIENSYDWKKVLEGAE